MEKIDLDEVLTEINEDLKKLYDLTETYDHDASMNDIKELIDDIETSSEDL